MNAKRLGQVSVVIGIMLAWPALAQGQWAGWKNPSPPVGGSQVQPTDGSTAFRVEVLYSSQESDDLYRGKRRVANPDDVMTSFQQETLHLSWRALDKLELGLLVPRVEIHNEARGQEDVDLEGLGDVSLVADWGP